MEDLEVRLEGQKTQVYTSMPFFNWLGDKEMDIDDFYFEFKEGYRFANPNYGPLSVVGRLSDGARFNIGGAQMSAAFPS